MTERVRMEDFQAYASRVAGRHEALLQMQRRLDGSSLSIPITILRGQAPGPELVLVSGQHGDEWNGPWILRELAVALDASNVSGTILFVPIANPMAFDEGMRVSSIDRVDMNRTYIGGTPRKPTEYLAEGLWNTIFAQADYLIDIHSGGPGEYLPFASTPRGVHLDLARTLNLPFIQTPNPSKNGFLVNACVEAGIAALLVEIGGGHSLDHVHHEAVQDGLVNLMRHVGVYAGSPAEARQAVVFEEKTIVPAPAAGFFVAQIGLGDAIGADELVGEIVSVQGVERTEVRSPRAGTVIYLRRAALVSEKASLVHLV